MANIAIPDVFQPGALDRMYSSRQSVNEYVLKKARQGDLQDIIDTVDRFGWTQQCLMNVGDRQGLILDEAIRTRQPKTVLELGTFLGYSSLRMAAQLPKDAHIFSIEFDEHSADIARAFHQYAGVDKRITIIIDHWKNAYLRDLKMREACNLMQSGTVIMADDVIFPGARNCLEYMQNNPNYTNTFHEVHLECSADIRDGVQLSIGR